MFVSRRHNGGAQRVDSMFESCELLDPNGTVGNLTFGADIYLETLNVTTTITETEYVFL